ncbi:MAG: flagellar biosynthesis anti-sigma factor FlgM [Pseudomonadota bacterium]
MIEPTDPKVLLPPAVKGSNEFAQGSQRMVSKINSGVVGTNSPRAPQSTPNAAARPAGPVGNAAEQPDRVTLTDTARLLQALEGALDDQPVLDTARIEQARAALAAGNYQIDADSIANKLLQLEGSPRP